MTRTRPGDSPLQGDTVGGAFEVWGIASMSRLGGHGSPAENIILEVTRLKGKAVPAQDPISVTTSQPVVMHSAMLPSPAEEVSESGGGLSQP